MFSSCGSCGLAGTRGYSLSVSHLGPRGGICRTEVSKLRKVKFAPFLPHALKTQEKKNAQTSRSEPRHQMDVSTALRQWSSTWSIRTPGVREDILGGTRKELTGNANLKKEKCMHNFFRTASVV
jgi:hypothetical protein